MLLIHIVCDYGKVRGYAFSYGTVSSGHIQNYVSHLFKELIGKVLTVISSNTAVVLAP